MIKMKRLRALLLTGVMTVTMACGGTVMADEGKSQDTVPEVEAEITKVLEFAEGVSVPNARFQFEITKVTEDAPDATIEDITYSSDDETGDVAGGKYSIAKDSNIVFGTFPHAGEYVYTVTEKADTYKEAENEDMIYSDASYELHVYVINDDDGLTVDKITAEKNGKKIDCIEFINTFIKNTQKLTISKETVGAYADKTKDFTFKIKFIKSATAGEETSYTGKIGNEEVVCVVDEEKEFELHDGESLVFENLPAGTRYVVTEVGAEDGYTPSVTVVENGVKTVDGKTAKETDSLTSVAGNQTSNLVGENTNTASFTNTYKDVAITGIVVNSLPFAVMIAAFAAVLGVLAVMKSRRSCR